MKKVSYLSSCVHVIKLNDLERPLVILNLSLHYNDVHCSWQPKEHMNS